jgi:ectoine hydroxylase-related dioxygenase (phytanoyl-CoA dioxygenase family)
MNYDLDDYLFDLRGYLVLRNAVDKNHIADLQATLDAFPPLEYGQWHGRVQRLDFNGPAGAEFQNVVEGGEPFQRLIDHPSWHDRLLRYCGEKDTYVEGLFIDECFASIRRTGGFFPMHSGGQDGVVRNQFRYVNGTFRCAQINILLALTDIGPGDGGTLVIPGSHKSNRPHPNFKQSWDERMKDTRPLEGTVEVQLQAGDALLFVDALCHGASARTNPGERRVVIFRYGPIWAQTRHGYRYSDELLARVTPTQRKILQPITPRVPPS